jgi:hypothetical protein
MKDIKLDLMDAAFAVHKLLHDSEQRIRHLEYNDKINKNCLLQMQEVSKENIRMVKDLTNLVDAQGQKGTWDISPYHTGLFNGLELALSIFEKREPKYRENPNSVTGQTQKRHNHLDDAFGAKEYIMERGEIFHVKTQGDKNENN